MRPAVLVLAVAFAVPALAEAPNLSQDPRGAQGSVARVVLAHRTHQAALAQGDAVLLLAALRLARSVTLRSPTSWLKSPEGSSDNAAPVPADATDPGGAVALAILQGMAADDPDLQDLVYDLDAQVPHPRQGTAAEARSALDAGQADSWRIPLDGQLPAEIALIGDGDSALSMTVTDDGGAVVCARAPGTAAMLCSFTPARNGFFTVEVRNTGPAQTGYRLLGT
jgi:hypothetical protein